MEDVYYTKYPHLDQLEKLVVDKKVTARKHPDLNLFIYNYAPPAMSLPPKDWPPALLDARGLVLDSAGNLIARGFRKFWNYEQVLDQVPLDEKFYVYEKLDGSLLIVFSYHGERVVATRGSFTSGQAIAATNWFNAAHKDFYPEVGNSWLFEWISPMNRIVVDYGKRTEAVLLGILDDGGNTIWLDTERFNRPDLCGVQDASAIHGPATASKAQYLETIKGVETSGLTTEGYVVHFPQSDFRCKIKFADYVRLHRLMFGTNTKRLWEMLKDENFDSTILDDVPIEFRDWVRTKVDEISKEYGYALARSAHDIQKVRRATKEPYGTAAFGRAVQDIAQYPSIVFAMAKGDFSTQRKIAWSIAKPKRAEFPFRESEE